MRTSFWRDPDSSYWNCALHASWLHLHIMHVPNNRWKTPRARGPLQCERGRGWYFTWSPMLVHVYWVKPWKP